MKNPWDELAGVFGYRCDEEEPSAHIADNIFIAWPSVLSGISAHFGGVSQLEILDFGCGGGHFCRHLHGLGNRVTGYDTSRALIEATSHNVPHEVTVTDSSSVLEVPHRYDVITSIMVFQFIQDIESVIGRLATTLKPGGLLVSAVFNPAFVLDARNRNALFSGFSERDSTGVMELQKGIPVSVYVRTMSEYRRLFAVLGCEQVYCDLPPFSDSFLAKYHVAVSTEHPEFLIQAFKKS